MKKIIVFLLSLTIALTPALLITNAYASGEETVDMLRKKIQLMAADIQDTRKKVVGYKRSIRDIVNEAGAASTVVKNHVAETVPTKSKVGKPMLDRAKAYKVGIAGIVGGAAITGLIEAIGWVMEDGTYVKYKLNDPNDPASSQYLWRYTYGTVQKYDAPSYQAACRLQVEGYKNKWTYKDAVLSTDGKTAKCYFNGTSNVDTVFRYI